MNEKRKKICYISEFEPTNIKAWSGSIYFIYFELAKRYEMTYIHAKKIKIIDFILKIKTFLMKIIHKKYMRQYSVFSAKIIAKKYKKILMNTDCDIFFVIGSQFSFLMENVNKPYIYFSDATFHLMINYYYKGLCKTTINDGELIQHMIMSNSKYSIFANSWAANSAVNDYRIDAKQVKIVKFGANLLKDVDCSKKTFDKNTIRLLLIGVEWERKGVDVAIKTVSYLNSNSNSDLNYHLTVIGVLPDANYQYDKNTVNFTGFLNKNIPSEYDKFIDNICNSDIFILPTKAECAGIVFCEVSGYGIPSITYNTGGVSDYVINGYNGYTLNEDSTYIDFAQTILEKMSTKEQLTKLSDNSIKIYNEELNWNKFGEKIVDIIETIDIN